MVINGLVTFIIVCGISFIPGAFLISVLFPTSWKTNTFWINAILPTMLGFVTITVSIVMSTLILVLTVYFVGMCLRLFIRTLDPDNLWRGVFGMATLITLVAYFAVLILVPNFLRFDNRSKQSEAKSNMASIHTSQISYYSEHQTYTDRFDLLKWSPEGKTRYSYYLSDEDNPNKVIKRTFNQETSGYRKPRYWVEHRWEPFTTLILIKFRNENIAEYARSEEKSLQEVVKKHGIGASKNGFTVIAIGNIDQDPVWDAWVINDDKTISHPLEDRNDTFSGQKSTLWLMDVYQEGVTIYPDRINLILFFLNVILWRHFSRKVRKTVQA